MAIQWLMQLCTVVSLSSMVASQQYCLGVPSTDPFVLLSSKTCCQSQFRFSEEQVCKSAGGLRTNVTSSSFYKLESCDAERGGWTCCATMLRMHGPEACPQEIVPTTAPEQCPHFEIEANDTDMAGALLAERASDTSDGCCPLCEEVDGCEGFAYLNQVCYLKGNFSGTFFQTGVFSRVKRALGAGCPGFQAAEQGKDLVGDLLDEWWAPNPEVCCAACVEKADCQGFAFFDGRCYLKANVRGTYGHDGCMVRLKEGVLSEVDAGCPGFKAAEQGKDLIGDLLESWSAPNPELCCAACAKQSECEGFAFVDGWCFLKANVRGTFGHYGCMVRVKEDVMSEVGSTPEPPQPQCPDFEKPALDTDMAGDLLAAKRAATSDRCCTFCEDEVGCEGFAYFEHLCYLKGNFSGFFSKAGVVSHIKKGVGGRRLGGMPLLV